jgi:hypothetical protein
MPADPACCNQPDGEPGVRLFAGHTGRVAGGLGWPVAGRGGHRPTHRAGDRPPKWAAVTARPRPCPRRRLTRARGHGLLHWDLGLFGGAPSAVFAHRGMGFGADARLTATCRIVHAAHVRQPCGSRNRQTAQPATRRAIGSQQLPRAASGPSLWPSTLGRSFSCCPWLRRAGSFAEGGLPKAPG